MKEYWDVYTAIFLAGFVSLMLELSLLREFVYIFGSTATSNALIISFFLVGLVAGSYWGALRSFGSNEISLRRNFALAQFMIIVYLGIFYLTKKYFIYEAASEPLILVFFFASVIIPAFVGGLSFALSVKILHPKGERYTTYIYAVSTLGSVVGSILHGMYVVPMFGLNATYLISVIIVMVVIFLIDQKLPLLKRGLVIVVAVIVSSVIYFNVADTIFNQRDVVYSKYSQSGLVEIKSVETARAQRIEDRLRGGEHISSIDVNKNYYDLLINNEHQAFNVPADVETHRYWANSTLALYDRPVQVMVLGYASGVTTATFLNSSKPYRVDTVEIADQMVEAAKQYFAAEHKIISEDPRSRIVIDDFRKYMRFTPELYDIIVLDIFIHDPYSAGFYTLEFFDLLKKHMNPDGVIVIAGNGLSWSTTRLSFDYIYQNNSVPFEGYQDRFSYLKTQPLADSFVDDFIRRDDGIVLGDRIYTDHRVRQVTSADTERYSLARKSQLSLNP